MSSVPGQRSKALVTDLRRAAANGALFLPRFNDEGIRTVVAESNEEYSAMRSMMGDTRLEELPDAVRVSCHVHHATIKRNKRCALAYIEQRATTLKKLRWELGPLLPEEKRNNMSHSERDFFAVYDTLLRQYSASTQIDLTSCLSPPKDLHVQVKVLRDCGEIMTEEGTISLEHGTVHHLRRRDVEHLVRQGYLEEQHHHD